MLGGATGAAVNYGRSLRSVLEFDFGEGIVLWQAQHILDTAKTYRNIDTPPHNVTHYPPLYHLAVRAAVGSDGDWLYAGRLVSYVSGLVLVLILGGLTFAILPRGTKPVDRITAAIVSGCSFFLIRPSDWIRLARVDMLGLALMFGGLALVCAARKKLARELLGIALMVAAGFTKHAFFTVPAACLLAQLFFDRRRFVILAAWGAVLATVPLFYLQSVTHGGFLLNLLGYNVNPLLLSALTFHLRLLLQEHVGLLALGSPLLVYGIVEGVRHGREKAWLRKVDASTFRWTIFLLALHLCISGVWLAGMGKVGSALNYALPFLLTLNLGAGLTTWYLLTRWKTARGMSIYPLACLAVAVALSQLPDVRPLVRTLPPASEAIATQERNRLIATLKAEKGPIYSEDMTALLQSGHDVPAEPAIVTLLAERGKWDESAFVNKFAQHYWSIVVVNDLSSPERYSPAVRRAIADSYTESERFGETKLFRPRTAAQ